MSSEFVCISTESLIRLFVTKMNTPPPVRRLRSFLYTLYSDGNTSEFFMLDLSHDSVPSTMSGLTEESIARKSRFFFFTDWQFTVMIFKCWRVCLFVPLLDVLVEEGCDCSRVLPDGVLLCSGRWIDTVGEWMFDSSVFEEKNEKLLSTDGECSNNDDAKFGIPHFKHCQNSLLCSV